MLLLSMDEAQRKSEKMNKSNLIPNSERSPEELREMGRKGGIASGKARRKKRDMEKRAKICMEVLNDLSKQGLSPNEAVRKLEELYKTVARMNDN